MLVAESVLAQLAIPVEDVPLFCRQGFVATERRTRGWYYKLRYRRAGRQVVIGLGSDAARAEAVAQELQYLQALWHARARLKRSMRAARRALRKSKAKLAPVLIGHGYRFHGLEIRKPRHGGRTPENDP